MKKDKTRKEVRIMEKESECGAIAGKIKRKTFEETMGILWAIGGNFNPQKRQELIFEYGQGEDVPFYLLDEEIKQRNGLSEEDKRWREEHFTPRVAGKLMKNLVGDKEGLAEAMHICEEFGRAAIGGEWSSCQIRIAYDPAQTCYTLTVNELHDAVPGTTVRE